MGARRGWTAFPEIRVDLHGGGVRRRPLAAYGVERSDRGLEVSATFSAWLAGAARYVYRRPWDVSSQPSAEFCSAWHMRLAPRTIRLGPWYAGKRPWRCLFGVFGWPLSRAALATWIRHQSVPETTDRDSAQRWPRRNPHARACRCETRSPAPRVSVATVAVVAMASGRDAVAAEAKYTRETRIPNRASGVRH